jgi:hypothetical protein
MIHQRSVNAAQNGPAAVVDYFDFPVAEHRVAFRKWNTVPIP